MNALILAAGFGTRMGKLSETVAKPLLEVAGKPITSHLAEKLFATGKINSLTVVSNNYYIDQFREWAVEFGRPDVAVLNDGVNTNDTRLGAVADLDFAVGHTGAREPLFVMAGDNLFEFDFIDMIEFFEGAGTDVVAAYRQQDVSRLRRTGVASIDESDRVIRFEEKPAAPDSDLAVPCIYIFRAETLKMVKAYLDEGRNPDAPGHFIAWLYTLTPLHAFIFDTPMHAVGDAESYDRVKRTLG